MASMPMGLRADLEAHASGLLAPAPVAGRRGRLGRAGSATNLCCWILPCSSSRPWNSASGRGGQPGMYTSTGTILSTPLTTL